jgi:hypothetical protein
VGKIPLTSEKGLITIIYREIKKIKLPKYLFAKEEMDE